MALECKGMTMEGIQVTFMMEDLGWVESEQAYISVFVGHGFHVVAPWYQRMGYLGWAERRAQGAFSYLVKAGLAPVTIRVKLDGEWVFWPGYL